jgi:hypothetical protein
MAEETGITEEKTAPTDAMDYFGYDAEQIAAQVADEGSQSDSFEAVQAKVNEILKETKVDENGKFIYPDNIDPAIKLAVAKEKAFRDTQASFTKTRQELKEKEAELEALREQISKYETPTSNLTPEEQLELKELKYTDPDEWFKRMKALEAKAQEVVEQKLNEVQGKAKAKTQQELLEEELNNFNKDREVPITKEILEMDVPPKWHQQLNSGEITFSDFLAKVANLIDSPTTIANPDAPKTTNIHTATGGVQEESPEPAIDYSKVIF